MFTHIATVACILLLAACTAPPAAPVPPDRPVLAWPAASEPPATAATAQAVPSPTANARLGVTPSAPVATLITPSVAPVPASPVAPGQVQPALPGGGARPGVTATGAPTSTSPSIPVTPAATSQASPALAATGAISATTVSTQAARLPAFKHVFIIVMENREASQILGSLDAAYINHLAGQYAYAANYFGIRHPSLPNYLALAGGDTFGVTSDCVTCFVTADNIVNQLERAGRSWKAYMESMPVPCFRAPGTTLYAQKHNPFIYFDDVRTDPARCNKIVPFEQFQADLATDALPQYVWITPNMCHDMHDCPVATGDDWLKTWVPKILASGAWQDDGVLFITFDEGASAAGCCQYAAGGKISTLVVSPLARRGFVSNVPYDHYSLLRTIEQAWGLPLLNHAACDCSPPMSDFFATP